MPKLSGVDSLLHRSKQQLKHEVQMPSYRGDLLMMKAHQDSTFLHENQMANSSTQMVLFMKFPHSNRESFLRTHHQHQRFHLVRKLICENICRTSCCSWHLHLNLLHLILHTSCLFRKLIHARIQV